MEIKDKNIIYIDMDGALVDFKGAMEKAHEINPEFREKYKHNPDEIPDIFKDPKPIHGAINAIKQLNATGLYDIFIATTATWKNPETATHKRLWIEKHFGDTFRKKMLITHRKDLLKGDYLIDAVKENGAKDFDGKLLLFGWNYRKKRWNDYQKWEDILKKLAEDNKQADWKYEELLKQCLIKEVGADLFDKLDETGFIKYHTFVKSDLSRPIGSKELVLSKLKKKSEYKVEYYFKKNENIDNKKFRKAYITKIDEKDEFFVIWDTKFLKAGGAYKYHFKMTEEGCKLLSNENIKCY
jgi:5'(3')-deoxyribonucleotidase